MEYNHHKTDGLFLAIALVGLRMMEEQARQAAEIAATLGDSCEITLLDKADLMYGACLDLETRAWFWEVWKAGVVERETDNALLTIALIGAIEAEDRRYRALAQLQDDLGLPKSFLDSMETYCRQSAYERADLWRKVEGRS